MNIEHPMVTQMNDFGYPKRYWPNEMSRNGYRLEDEDREKGFDDDETSDDI